MHANVNFPQSFMLPSAMDTKWLPGQVVQRQYASWDDNNIKGVRRFNTLLSSYFVWLGLSGAFE